MKILQHFMAPFLDPPKGAAVASLVSELPAPSQNEGPTNLLFGDIKLAHLESEEETNYIYIDPAEFPLLLLGPKPHYAVYKGLREQYLNAACQAVEKYLAVIFKIDALENDVYSQKVIRKILRYFLIRYWDMPSSVKHHHSYPWGHLCHCLEVAIGMARQGSRWTPFTRHGIDEAKRSRYRGLVTVFYCMQGLMHDSYKLFQYALTAHTSLTNMEEFSPLERGGNVLDFKLKHGANYREGWKALNGDHARYNVLEFITLFPHSAMRDMPADVFYHAIFSFFDYKNDDIDIMSAVKDIQRSGGTLENIAGIINEYFTISQKGRNRQPNNVFFINEKLFAVDSRNFFDDMPKSSLFTDSHSLIKYLEFSNLVQKDHGLVFRVKTAPYFKGDDGLYKRMDSKELVFLSREIIRHVDPEFLAEIKTIVFTSAARQDLAPIADAIASNIIDHALLPDTDTAKTGKGKQDMPPALSENPAPPASTPTQTLEDKLFAVASSKGMALRGDPQPALTKIIAPPIPPAKPKEALQPVPDKSVRDANVTATTSTWVKAFTSILNLKNQDHIGKGAWVFMQTENIYLEKNGVFAALGKHMGRDIAPNEQGSILAVLIEKELIHPEFINKIEIQKYSSKTQKNSPDQRAGCFFKMTDAGRTFITLH